MENSKNKSEKAIDQLRNEAVKGEEIKGGNGVVVGPPDVFGPDNLPSDPLNATHHPDPNLAISDGVVGDVDLLNPSSTGDKATGDDLFKPADY